MVDERITDGTRIAQLLASELDGRRDGALDRVSIEAADPDVEPTAEGAKAYEIAADGGRIAEVFVHPERARIAFESGVEAALEAASRVGLRARRAPDSTRALVVVESGAAVKAAADVVEATV